MTFRPVSNAPLCRNLEKADRRLPRNGDAFHVSARARLRPTLYLSALAAIMLPGAGSAAADYATRDVGPWTVSASSDKQGCFVSRTYSSSRASTLLLSLDINGHNRLTILNANWSIRERESVRLTFRLSNASFPRHLAVGLVVGGKKGFVTSFGQGFPNYFASSASLRIERGEVPVENLRLDGSGAAVAELRKCVNEHRHARTKAQSVEEDADRIPTDPFAVKTKRESSK